MSDVTDRTTPDARTMTATEAALAEMWRDLLGRGEVATTDDFFALGGTSLTAIKLLQRVEKRFGPDSLTPETLYGSPRLDGMAKAIDEGQVSG
jgi:hypothetical protein